MRKKFITNLALLLALNLLIKPFWFFGIDRVVQNTVGASEYGLYLALFNFALIFQIILDLGITNFNNKNIAQHNQLLSKHLSNIVAIKFTLAIAYAIIVFTFAFIIGWRGRALYILSFLVLNQFLSSFILYLRSNLSGLHLFKTDSIISITDKLLMIFIVGYLLLQPVTKANFKIEWLVYSQTIAYSITLLITFLLLYRKLDFFTIKFNRKFFIAFFKQSYPYALLILLMSFYNRIEPIMLERILPDTKNALDLTTSGQYQAGIYAQAFRILEVSSMFGVLFAGLLLPIFAKMIKQKDDVGQLVQLSFSLIIVPAILLAVISNVYSDKIIILLYHQASAQSATLLSILMTGFIFVSTTYIFGTLLTANGSMKALNIMAFIGMILNISLNFYLIPKFLSIGASFASLTTQGVTALIQVFIAYKIFKFKINYTYIFKLIFLIIILYISASFVKTNINIWWVGVIVLTFIALSFSFLTGILSLKSMYRIIKYDE